MTDWTDEPEPIRELMQEGADRENNLGAERRLRRLEAAFIAAYRRQGVTADGGAVACDQEVHALQDRVEELEARVAQLVGLAEGEQSTPEKRAVDVCLGLQNIAEQRGGRAQWAYRDIQDHLESIGHEKVHAPQAYRVMDDLDDLDGFAQTENSAGDSVLRCKSAAVNAEAAVNEINNASGESPAPEHDSVGVNASQP